MTARLPFEELARRRTKRRSAQIRKLIEDISYDWYGEIDSICDYADQLGNALDDFDKVFDEMVEHVMRERREGDQPQLSTNGAPTVPAAGAPTPPSPYQPENADER